MDSYEELRHQQALSLRAVERMTSVLVLPHPDRRAAYVRRYQSGPATEATAMRVVMDHERGQGRHVDDVSAKNLGYDMTSLDRQSADLRLIEVKGLAAATGTILLAPNERRVAEDRRDCYWLYVVTGCGRTLLLQKPIADPARLQCHEAKKSPALLSEHCYPEGLNELNTSNSEAENPNNVDRRTLAAVASRRGNCVRTQTTIYDVRPPRAGDLARSSAMQGTSGRCTHRIDRALYRRA